MDPNQVFAILTPPRSSPGFLRSFGGLPMVSFLDSLALVHGRKPLRKRRSPRDHSLLPVATRPNRSFLRFLTHRMPGGASW